jgi:hypothetical protein
MVGNISNYTRIDILRCLLSVEKNISRQELVHNLQIGEGSIRTILDILKNKKLITSTREGHLLTSKGNLINKKILQKISQPKYIAFSLYPKYEKIAVIAKDIKPAYITIEKRDVAVKNGAEGCLIFRQHNQKLELLIFHFNQNFRELNNMPLHEGEILIITFSETKRWAEISALAVALELNPALKELFNSFC